MMRLWIARFGCITKKGLTRLPLVITGFLVPVVLGTLIKTGDGFGSLVSQPRFNTSSGFVFTMRFPQMIFVSPVVLPYHIIVAAVLLV